MDAAVTGERRAAVVSTVVVLLLAAAGVFALWPRTAAVPSPSGGASVAAAASDADLAASRAAAALAPCPVPEPAVTRSGVGAGRGVPSGPLAGRVVPCLGAPGTVDVGAALAGRVTLVNFWGSWCAPCRAELPLLAQYAARPGAVAVLGVDLRDDPRAALALLADLDVHLPSVTDPDEVLRAALDVPPGLPMSYLVRADGSVARVDPPVPFTSVDAVAAAVARLT